MKRILLAVLSISVLPLLLSGCFVGGSEYREAPKPGKGDATVYLLRPSTEEMADQQAWFFIDDVLVAKLKRNSHTWINLPAGKYTLRQQWSENGNLAGEQINVAVTWEPGKRYYHTLSLTRAGSRKAWNLISSRKITIFSKLIDSSYIEPSGVEKLRR